MMNSKRPHMMKKAIMMILGIAIVVAALSFIVMTLWNEILVAVLGVNSLNIWQAAGLIVLCRILFGRMGPPPWKGRHAGRGHWREKWKNMSDEERQALRDRWKHRGATEKNE